MGRLSFGHMLFFGSGAYAAGLLVRYVTPNPLLAILVGICGGALVGAILGPVVVRATGACFALINLAFDQVGYFLALSPLPSLQAVRMDSLSLFQRSPF